MIRTRHCEEAVRLTKQSICPELPRSRWSLAMTLISCAMLCACGVKGSLERPQPDQEKQIEQKTERY